ncbi:GNAT family N-acetyltransferase [Chromobacterium sp.]|uniref:GNAT family N-acetyltransferase n=1 Tax=Chromobacterium sp. TaxID=306190 RepID=UPI0035B36352
MYADGKLHYHNTSLSSTNFLIQMHILNIALRLLKLLRPKERPISLNLLKIGPPLWMGTNKKSFVLTISHPHQGFRIGTVVADFCNETKACYIRDITVDKNYQKQGIALRLLDSALKLSGCSQLVPVDIDEVGLPFWCHLALAKKIPIRLGLKHVEIQFIRHCTEPLFPVSPEHESDTAP